ncbi:hypothetical protein BD410DRAFT_780005 [Rickenella mellea]|uniref:Uncharacterized protein n=1 Tax=Rickenella mellea TaxID=50990 RepID=A0A4R5XFL1_9AGAM|nr:hypothetical protein BD410DRAFT_780005 [Rickenella mellea]
MLSEAGRQHINSASSGTRCDESISNEVSISYPLAVHNAPGSLHVRQESVTSTEPRPTPPWHQDFHKFNPRSPSRALGDLEAQSSHNYSRMHSQPNNPKLARHADSQKSGYMLSKKDSPFVPLLRNEVITKRGSEEFSSTSKESTFGPNEFTRGSQGSNPEYQLANIPQRNWNCPETPSRQRKSLQERLSTDVATSHSTRRTQEPCIAAKSDAFPLPQYLSSTYVSPHTKTETHASPVFVSPNTSLSEAMITNVPQQEDAPSRSQSTVTSAIEVPMDDISSIMIKGATDLRQVKLQLEEQKNESHQLQRQLASAMSEKADMAKELRLVKEKAKECLKVSATNLQVMGKEFEDLKKRSKESFQLCSDIRASIPDVKDLRESVQESMDHLESLINVDGELVQRVKIKASLDELRMECASKQQVIDILRDRLESLQCDVVDAKNRAGQLEESQLRDKMASQSLSGQLTSAGAQLADLAATLKEQQQESIRVSTINHELVAKLSLIGAERDSLNLQLHGKDLEIRLAKDKHDELVALRSLLGDRDKEIGSMRTAMEQLLMSSANATDLEERSKLLTAEISSKGLALDQSLQRISAFEAILMERTNLIKSLESELQQAKVQTQADGESRARILAEKDAVVRAMDLLEQKAAALRTELDETRTRVSEESTRREILQERFEDQAVTLRMEKEAHGDTQERLLTVSMTYARTTEENKNRSQEEVSRLRDQFSTLESKLHDRQADFELRNHSATQKITELENQIAEHTRYQSELHRSEGEQAERAKKDLDIAQEELLRLRSQLIDAGCEVEGLRCQLREALTVSERLQPEVSRLRSTLKATEGERDELIHKTKTIHLRYDKGELDVEEKALVESLHRTAQLTNEREMVEKGNEIKKRDNTIKYLQDRNNLLEATVARHLNTQAKAKANAGFNHRSLIDLDSWMSSQSSSDPPTHPGTRAPDRDIPCTINDVADTPVPIQRVAVLNDPHRTSANPVNRPIDTSTSKHAPDETPTSFAEHMADGDGPDVTDNGTFKSMSTLKRVRHTSVARDEEQDFARPTRRSRTATRGAGKATEDAVPAPQMTKEASAKPKSRKRR